MYLISSPGDWIKKWGEGEQGLRRIKEASSLATYWKQLPQSVQEVNQEKYR